MNYFISTGEPSGDLLGSELVRALGEKAPQFKAYGIVGPELRKASVEELYGIEDLSVMGFLDVLSHFMPIKKLEDELISHLIRLQPAFIVLVDYPGFHLHLAERLRFLQVPIFQYVAPQLWAWGEKRVHRLRRVTDKVFGIMPFEIDFFHRHGVDIDYVGTPQVDRVARIDPKDRLPLPAGKTIGLFPGSRRGELTRILPPMLETAAALLAKEPSLSVAISIAPGIEREWLREFFHKLGQPHDLAGFGEPGVPYLLKDRLFLVRGKSLQLMRQVDAALVTSGTATLECALSLTPMAVIYVAGKTTYAIGKRLVKLTHISLVNLVADEALVKEFVQHFSIDELRDHLLALSEDHPLKARLASLNARLKGQPGLHCAEAILSYLSGNKGNHSSLSGSFATLSRAGLKPSAQPETP